MATDSNGTLIQKNDIINNSIITREIKEKLIIISILESLYNIIDQNKFYEKIKKEKKYMTLKDMAIFLHNSRLLNSSGLLGISFERFVFDCIITKHEDFYSELKKILYKLDGKKISDEIDAILWGIEKGIDLTNPLINITLKECLKDDIIGKDNFKMKSLLIDNFRIIREKQNNNVAGKADLFVKQKGHNKWHSINVKVKYEDLKMNSNKYSNLEIGVALTTDKLNIIKKDKLNSENFQLKNDNIYIFQKKYDYAFYFNVYLYYFKELLKEIACGPNKKNTSSLIGQLPKFLQMLYFKEDLLIADLALYLNSILEDNITYLPSTKFIPNNKILFLFNENSYLFDKTKEYKDFQNLENILK